MRVPPTTLQYEVPYFQIRNKEEAVEIVRQFFVSGEKVVVSDDMVIANQRLLEAYIFLGMPEIDVVTLPFDPVTAEIGPSEGDW